MIDVRSLEEVKTGVIQDAIHIEWTKIEEEITNLDISKDQYISTAGVAIDLEKLQKFLKK